MLKKHFHDGLLQLAIVLSLLRSELDLNNYLNISSHDTEIDDIIMGPLSGYTQTHRPLSWHSTGYIHHKNFDSYADSILSDLHSLSFYRRFDGMSTDISAAWLVNNTFHGTSPPPADIPETEQEENTGGLQSNIHQAQVNVNIQEPTPIENQLEGAVSREDPPNNNELLYPGSLLTEEDLELIEVLWRQDIDMGVSREMYDATLRKEKEKERELKKQKLKEEELELKEEDDKTDDEQVQNFMVDVETGELVPAPENLTAPLDDVFLQNGTGLDDTDGLSVDEAMHLLEEQIQNEDSSQLVPSFNMSLMQRQVDSMIETAEEYNQMCDSDMGFQRDSDVGFQRQDSYEQRWEEVNSLISQQAPQQGNHTYTQLQEYSMDNSTSNPLVQNASLVPAEGYDQAGNFVGPLDQSLIPVSPTTADNATLSGLAASSSSSGNLFDIANQNFTLQNVANNQTGNFLDQLLADDGLMEVNFTDMAFSTGPQPMDEASSDSAVSSLGASASPIQDHFTEGSDLMSNYASSTGSASPFEGLVGATGGSYDTPDTKSPTKYEQYDSQYDYSYRSGSVSSNSSSEFNSSSLADIKQVKHNHSYPLQPGQQPKERAQEKRDQDEATRDQKRIDKMKIPFTINDIVHSPVEEFNEMLRKFPLTDSQLQFIRDIRRRGKNKVAAQNCRKRKLDVITTLEDEMEELRREKNRLVKERAEIDKARGQMEDKYSHLYREVFASLRDDNGHPYDPEQYSLQQTDDGNVFLMPRNTSQLVDNNHKDKSSRKRKDRKEN